MVPLAAILYELRLPIPRFAAIGPNVGQRSSLARSGLYTAGAGILAASTHGPSPALYWSWSTSTTRASVAAGVLIRPPGPRSETLAKSHGSIVAVARSTRWSRRASTSAPAKRVLDSSAKVSTSSCEASSAIVDDEEDTV